ncbi:MAG: hypothetical protein VYB40_04200 [Candidatus Thermoplasmatota archaeon]|nr:hypothetical protein [Candidatus Thermoplasmatota archaeon]
MTEQETLQGPQLAAIEAQLHALLRQQAKHSLPVDLPRPDFWHSCSLLLQSIELELTEIGRSEGLSSAKVQTLTRRQGNLRRAISDLTRHRLTAFVNHAALSSLTSSQSGESNSANLAPVNWQKQDGAERAFNEGVAELIEQYKRNVSWNGLQQGILNSVVEVEVKTPAGNAQLDQFVEDGGGLTGQEPPEIEEIREQESWVDPEFDDEDRIAMMEEFPEITPLPMEEESSNLSENNQENSMVRLRILRDLEEPIIDARGEEIELLEGDTYSCEPLIADTLIAAGWAEAAPLD